MLVAVGVMTFITPMDAVAHCEDGHADECSAECACACHPVPVVVCSPHRDGLTCSNAARFNSTNLRYCGRLLIADIFRPPVSA